VVVVVGGAGRNTVSRPMRLEEKEQRGDVVIRASVLKFPTPNGKDGSLIEGQATKEGTFNDKKF